MQRALVLGALVVVGCTGASGDDSPQGRDLATDDVVDTDARSDAARPVGIYTLVDPDSFEEGWPRMVHLDLRRNDTVYVYEIGPSLDEGNFGEGYTSYFGTYTLNKDRYGNRYLRVKNHEGSSWRYKYKVDGDHLRFLYRSGEVGWSMKREADPTPEHLARIQQVFEAGTNRRKADRASSHPDAVWSRFYELRDLGDYGVYTLNVDGTVHYMVEGESQVEIYARNNQFLAAAQYGNDWEWTADLF